MIGRVAWALLRYLPPSCRIFFTYKSCRTQEILFSRLPGLIRGVESGKQHERKMQWLKVSMKSTAYPIYPPHHDTPRCRYQAMDHFVCAESHGDELAHPELEELGAQVAQHAAWRFHQW